MRPQYVGCIVEEKSNSAHITLSPIADQAEGLRAQGHLSPASASPGKLQKLQNRSILKEAEGKEKKLICGISLLSSIHCARQLYPPEKFTTDPFISPLLVILLLPSEFPHLPPRVRVLK